MNRLTCVVVVVLGLASGVVQGEGEAPARPEAGVDSIEMAESVVAAVDVEESMHSGDWRSRGQLLGGMGGLRPWLERHGMTLELESLDESFGSPDIDTGTGGRYAGLTHHSRRDARRT
jgi:hypothetical protein